MRTKRKAIAIIDQDHVPIRSWLLPQRMEFSEATGGPKSAARNLARRPGPPALTGALCRAYWRRLFSVHVSRAWGDRWRRPWRAHEEYWVWAGRTGDVRIRGRPRRQSLTARN